MDPHHKPCSFEGLEKSGISFTNMKAETVADTRWFLAGRELAGVQAAARAAQGRTA